jgi:citrate lyase subunit beta/citryl-CoA lyase
MLFVPAVDRRKIDKALGTPADCVILDLEDAVALADKSRARDLARDVLKAAGPKCVYVRVNGVTTPFVVGDLLVVVGGVPDGIMLPKVESGEEVLRVDWLLGQLEEDSGLVRGQIDLIPLIETARGVLKAGEIAATCPRVKRTAFGAVDYTLDLGVSLSQEGEELFYPRSRLVVTARAAGREGPVDSVYPDVGDQVGLERECRLARKLGFQGKLAIHPAQIDVINEIFTPTRNEIEFAAKVARAFASAEKEGVAAIRLGGRFIDYPVAAQAARILEKARLLGLYREDDK